MTGLLERIEQEIVTLKQHSAELAGEMQDAYHNYLTLLGTAVRQQMTLATYQICTQSYPKEFLELAYLQRQQLQYMLRQLAKQVQTDLLAQLTSPLHGNEHGTGTMSATPLADSSLADPVIMDWGMNESNPSESAASPPIAVALAPTDLLHWQKNQEEMLALELHTASHGVNRLLQQFDILPKQIPEFLLETAAKADAADVGDGPPNLLRLMIEAVNASEVNANDLEGEEFDQESEIKENGEGDQRKPRSVMQVVALHLRVAEIEFADPAVSAARSRIRHLQAQLKTLVREYHKKQRERAIAQAQAAWRSTWVEE